MEGKACLHSCQRISAPFLHQEMEEICLCSPPIQMLLKIIRSF